MSTQLRPTTAVHPQDLRRAAERQARSLSSALMVLGAGLVAMVLVFAFVFLDYRGVDAHRIVKMVIGLPVAMTIAFQPTLGLLLFPISAPYLLLMPQLPIPGINTLNALLLGVFGIWAVMMIITRHSIGRKAWLFWPILGVFVIMAISLVRAVASPVIGAFEGYKAMVLLFRTTTTLIPYFIFLLMVRNDRDSKRLFAGVVFALVAETITTIWFGEWGGARAKGSMGQPNALGAFMSISSVLVGSMLLAQRQWWSRLFFLTVLVGGVYGTVLTISRGSLMALIAGLSFVALRSSKLLTIVIVAALMTAPIWVPDSVKDRVMSTQQQDEDSDDVELEGSAQARIDTWTATMDLAKDHLIDGLGFGSLPYILVDYGKKMGLKHTHESTHNTYLRMLGEMGIPGLVLYLALLVGVWMLGAAGLKAARTRYQRQLAIGLQGALIAVCLNCWFGDRFFELDIMCAFWVTCALVNDFVNRHTIEAT